MSSSTAAGYTAAGSTPANSIKQLIEDNKALEAQFADIPGTVLFDKTQSRLGYELNMFCMSLMKDVNRQAFRADTPAYLDQFAMSKPQCDAVIARDYNQMIALGGNIYFLAKIGATDGDSFQKLASIMTGASEEDYRNMMIAGGRNIEGNRSNLANQSVKRDRHGEGTVNHLAAPVKNG